LALFLCAPALEVAPTPHIPPHRPQLISLVCVRYLPGLEGAPAEPLVVTCDGEDGGQGEEVRDALLLPRVVLWLGGPVKEDGDILGEE